MAIDIRGTSTVNKGAQLMLEAVVSRLGSRFELTAAPQNSEYAIRSRLGLRQTLHDYLRPQSSIILGNLVPSALLTRYGLVPDKSITGVVDASGFAYGDPFELRRIKREAIFGKSKVSSGVPIVMLPQAFGPFREPKKREWAKRVLNQANLIFARDRISEDYLKGLKLDSDIVRCTDFTIGLRPEPVSSISDAAFGIVVPNSKMISSGILTKEQYLFLLTGYMEALRAQGLAVVIMVHETGDGAFARELKGRSEATIFEHQDPLVLKAVLGQAEFIISSRFHAVVGGLSQGIRTVALGWSHKYRELLGDFGVEQWLASVEDSPVSVVTECMGDKSGLDSVESRKVELISEVSEMWRRTEAALGAP
jgi:colanic acid/amylovoran biosynthesis protein